MFCPLNVVTRNRCVRVFTHFFILPVFVYEFIASQLNILARARAKNFRHFDSPRTLPRLSFVIKFNIFRVPPAHYYKTYTHTH